MKNNFFSIGSKELAGFVDMTFGGEWFDYIEGEIKEIYKIESPQFKIADKIVNIEDIVDWIDNKLNEHRWVKYKHISENIFELKDCLPDPSDEVCLKIIEDFMNYFRDEDKEVFFKWGSRIYNEDEAKDMLFESLKEGYFEIYCGSTHLNDPEGENRLIFDLSVGESSEFHRSYDCGYLTLEMRDEAI